MAQFRAITAKAKLILILLFSFEILVGGNTVTAELPDVSGILHFLQNIIKPYFSTFRSSDGIYRETIESPVDDVINQKLEDLKPFLQDDDKLTLDKPEDNNNLTLEGKDETTIIEFLPNNEGTNKNSLREESVKEKDSLRNNVNKYMKIRKKIKKALMKEQVSEKTQNLVTTTLDDMIARIIEKKCYWGSGMQGPKQNNKIGRTLSAKEWDEQWIKLKPQYFKFINNTSDTFPGNHLFHFFEQFHNFFGHIRQDLQSMEGKYKFFCQILEKDAQNKEFHKHLRMGQREMGEGKHKHKCEHFRVCSEELKKIMSDFYYALNDTAVSALRNYASMYVRDVNTEDSHEKESVTTVLGNISDLVEYKTRKIFIRETSNFKLNEKKEEHENIRALRTYIKNTVENTKDYINNNLESGLKSLKATLLQTVKQDLSVNLDVDLGNLERDFKSRICTVFSICNGKYETRRSAHHRKHLDRNSVYVKVQLTLDDELRDKFALPPQFKGLKSSKSKGKTEYRYDRARAYEKTSILSGNLKNYSMPNVTRTTLSISTKTSENKIDGTENSTSGNKKNNNTKG